MKVGNYNVTIQRDPVTHEGIVHVEIVKGKYSTFRYSPLQAATMTIDKLEKMVKEHVKAVQDEAVKKANCETDGAY